MDDELPKYISAQIKYTIYFDAENSNLNAHEKEITEKIAEIVRIDTTPVLIQDRIINIYPQGFSEFYKGPPVVQNGEELRSCNTIEYYMELTVDDDWFKFSDMDTMIMPAFRSIAENTISIQNPLVLNNGLEIFATYSLNSVLMPKQDFSEGLVVKLF